MNARRRVEALEAAHYRKMAAAYRVPGYTVDTMLEAMIRWLEMSPEQQAASMPEFTPAELAEIRAWLPGIRRARMRA
jgi:hypothetical protein